MDCPTRYAGVDWASRAHAVCIVDERGAAIERFEVEHSGPGLRSLGRRLAGARVAGVAIERPDGPVVDALLAAGLTVFVIASRHVKALRTRYGTAGNKDDRADFAEDSRFSNPWAADLYARARARKKTHPHAGRILARAWVYVIWRCWQDRVPYDPARHRALQQVVLAEAA